MTVLASCVRQNGETVALTVLREEIQRNNSAAKGGMDDVCPEIPDRLF